ncbi:MAG: hypothetical protein AAFN00_05130 [Cyanobacteria bacterium J06558_2]
MTYESTVSSQTYGEQEFLAHCLKGDGENPDLYLVGQRVPSYGIINFNNIRAGKSKSFKPLDHGIKSPIELRSINALTTSTGDQIEFFINNENTLLGRQRVSNNEVPYTFPPGTILRPELTLIVKPTYNTTQLVIYWQPVHVLSYINL